MKLSNVIALGLLAVLAVPGVYAKSMDTPGTTNEEHGPHQLSPEGRKLVGISNHLIAQKSEQRRQALKSKPLPTRVHPKPTTVKHKSTAPKKPLPPTPKKKSN